MTTLVQMLMVNKEASTKIQTIRQFHRYSVII